MNTHAMMAKVYINQARATKWPKWREKLLRYAANRRAMFYAEILERKKLNVEPQMDMFS